MSKEEKSLYQKVWDFERGIVDEEQEDACCEDDCKCLDDISSFAEECLEKEKQRTFKFEDKLFGDHDRKELRDEIQAAIDAVDILSKARVEKTLEVMSPENSESYENVKKERERITGAVNKTARNIKDVAVSLKTPYMRYHENLERKTGEPRVNTFEEGLNYYVRPILVKQHMDRIKVGAESAKILLDMMNQNKEVFEGIEKLHGEMLENEVKENKSKVVEVEKYWFWDFKPIKWLISKLWK